MARNRLSWKHGTATVTVTGREAASVADAAAHPQPVIDTKGRGKGRRRGRR
jgi:hypothetical protein